VNTRHYFPCDVGPACRDLQYGPEERVEDRLDGQARQLLERIEHLEPAVVDRLDQAADNRGEEGLLGLEVVVDGGQIHFGVGGDGAERGSVEAVASEDAFGGVEDAGLGLAALSRDWSIVFHTVVLIVRTIGAACQSSPSGVLRARLFRGRLPDCPEMGLGSIPDFTVFWARCFVQGFFPGGSLG
jgi:hypothetical protein